MNIRAFVLPVSVAVWMGYGIAAAATYPIPQALCWLSRGR